MTRANPTDDPFYAGSCGMGHAIYRVDADSRIARAKGFTLDECRRALKVDGLQKTVRIVIERRIRKLERGARL